MQGCRTHINVKFSFKKGKLHINDVKYESEVIVPSVRSVLLLNPEQENKLEQLKIHKGPIKIEQGSVFESYVAMAESIEDVQKMYQAIHRQHISATHLMSGYRVFGSRFAHLQDFTNDGEHGGGRTILNTMKSVLVWNMVVFIVRYHNGPNLGPRRFDIITELTKDVITSYPGSLNYGQYFGDQITLKNLNDAAVRPTRPVANTEVKEGAANNEPPRRETRKSTYRGRGGRGGQNRS